MLVGLSLVATASSADAQRRRQGTLVIVGEHPGAQVYVDAELVGEMPLDALRLAPGNHTLRVVRPGYTEYTDVFRIRPRRTTEVAIDLMAISMALTVETEPPGARVFVTSPNEAEEFAGNTPVALDLLEGTHALRLALRGYEELTREIAASPGSPKH